MGFQVAASDWSVRFQAVASDWSTGFQASLPEVWSVWGSRGGKRWGFLFGWCLRQVCRHFLVGTVPLFSLSITKPSVSKIVSWTKSRFTWEMGHPPGIHVGCYLKWEDSPITDGGICLLDSWTIVKEGCWAALRLAFSACCLWVPRDQQLQDAAALTPLPWWCVLWRKRTLSLWLFLSGCSHQQEKNVRHSRSNLHIINGYKSTNRRWANCFLTNKSLTVHEDNTDGPWTHGKVTSKLILRGGTLTPLRL